MKSTHSLVNAIALLYQARLKIIGIVHCIIEVNEDKGVEGHEGKQPIESLNSYKLSPISI